ncbi:thiopeptide-type bacteriocin biosynthesis protein [Actinomyces howellii]|uniref:Thiopeptide-type bacteriocin biosynthesis domain n=1 Tax=Actinomyces howellii TaxID=52771 RepID=A0A448HG64_9ACTO|nr:thiopeptide-type bacteriocin biosynthesis domain [Actinomyces howellii]
MYSANESETTWLSVHLRCDSNIDEFLTDMLFPLVDRVEHSHFLERYFYLRHWMAGSHVRLRLKMPPSDHEDVLDLILGRTTTWLSERRQQVNPYAEQWYEYNAPELAMREHQTEVPKWREHGSVWNEQYVPEVQKYGSGDTLAAFEKQFCASTELARAVLDRTHVREQLLSFASMIIYVTWANLGLRMGPPHQEYSILVRRWEPLRQTDPSWPVYRSKVDPCEFANRMNNRTAGAAAAPESGWLSSLEELTHTLRTVPEVEQSRNQLLVNRDHCLHLFCNRLGLSLEQEASARQLAYSAVQSSVLQSY